MSDFDIAIIGMAGRFPGAPDVDVLWAALRAGRELITHFERDELVAAGIPAADIDRPGYVGARGVLAGAELFDAGFFGFSPREAEVLDPQHRLFLECAWESLEDAGYDPWRYPGSIGVFAGVGMNTYLLKNIIPDEDLVASIGDFQIMALNDKDTLPSRVSYKLNLRGPSVDVQTSCSTGLVAVHLACESLNGYGCDLALAGAVAVKFPQQAGYRYIQGGIASPDGRCRAFDARAEGTVGGGGLGIVVLKRAADAVADGDRILALIRASAVNNDGNRKVSYSAPSVPGQAEVIAAALAQAGVGADTIGYVEAHGTGTPIGDPIEIEALTRAFRAGTDRVGYCALGAVKTNIGHLDTAAGMAGLIKAVLAVQTGEIPPTLHFTEPNPKIDLAASPFFVCDRLRPWPLEGGPRRSGVSSFGVGGTNAHVILENAPPRSAAPATGSPELLVWSAREAGSLDAAVARFRDWLPTAPDADALADIAWTLQRGRAAFQQRAALVCRDREQALRLLDGPAAPSLIRGTARVSAEPDTVLLFPGQGAQRVSMAPELYQRARVYRETVDDCAELLRPSLGLDLRAVLYPHGDAEQARERLRHTQLTQPAIFVLDYALARQWLAWGVRPAALIGHSVGELVAACLAGVFSLEDALRLVALRGRLIGELPPGAMLSVRLPAPELAAALADDPAAAAVGIAAYNGPNATVLSGPAEAIGAVERRLRAREVLCTRLETSHAFHSPAMAPAAAALERALRGADLSLPRIPIVSTVTGAALGAEQARDPAHWARQVVAPVRFADAVAIASQAHQHATWLEVGPGQALATLVRPMLAGDDTAVAVSSLPAPERGSDLDALLAAAGRLWVRGHGLDLASPYGDRARRRVRLPTYPFARERYWIDPPASRPAGGRSTPGIHKRADLDNWFYAGGWMQRSTTAAAPPGRNWLLFADDAGLAAGLAAGLDRIVTVDAGDRFTRVSPARYVIDPSSAEDYTTLTRSLAADGFQPTGIVHAFGLRDAHDFSAAQDLGLHSLLRLGCALDQPADGPLPLWIVTRNLFDVIGTEVVVPDRATVLGAASVLPQERPWIRCGLVDLDGADGLGAAALVASELAREHPETTVAFRGGRRWVRSFELVAVPDSAATRVRAGGAGVVFGGLGRFGRLAAKELARLGHTRITLVDRAEATAADLAELADLRRYGAEVETVQADIADAEQARRAVQDVLARVGVIDGVIHAAGPEELLATIEETDAAVCEAHFATKVRGLVNLDRALAAGGAAPRFAVITSSLVAVLGGVGHAGYAAATAFAEAFARRAGPVPWQSVGFETWNLTGEVVAAGTGRSNLAMTAEETAAVLRRVLSEPAARVQQLIVSTADLPSRIAHWVERPSAAAAAAGGPAGTSHDRPNLATPYVAPRTDLERAVTGVWEELLGIGSIGVYDSFFELGGDSLLATRIVSRIRSRFEVDLPLRRLFEFPTPAKVAALVAEAQADGSDLETVQALLAELDSLPAEVVREELRKAGLPTAERQAPTLE